MRLLLRRFSVAGGLLFFTLLCVAAIAAPQYEIYDLGVLQVDHMGSEGFGISPGGIGVGCSLTGDGQVVDGSQSFTWTQGGGLTGLPNVAGRIFCNSNSANGSGTVIGTCINLQGADELPVIWQNGVGLPLPLPTGYTVGRALSVNASGIVVGSAGDRGVIFTGSNPGIITQTTANGSYFTEAKGINDSGRIVGRGSGPGGAVGIVHDTSTNTTFSVGAFQGATNAIAYGVNNSGTVVGAGYPLPDYFIGLPFVWTETNGMIAIPLVQGTEGGGGYAQSVNSDGWVVGKNYWSGDPFLYDGDSVYRLIDILPPDSGWNVAGYPPSLGISDDGTIVGTGLHKLEFRAWAMVRLPSTPTPTPTGTPTPTPPPTTTRLVISAAYPNSVGQSFRIAVTARDQFNHTAVGYTGTVHFTSTSSGTLPANSTLTNGTAFFEVTLTTPGQQTITATDTTDSSITGTSNPIFVPAPSSVTPTPTATAPPPTPTPSVTPPLTPTPTPSPSASSSPSSSPSATLTPTPTPTLIVTNTNDSGADSLRQALMDAQDGDVIGFAPALNGQTILLTSGELLINKSITIRGPGPALLTIMRAQQAPGFRIFHVQETTTVLIEGLTITGGYASIGGGILDENTAGVVTISNCVVTGNRVGSPTPAPTATPPFVTVRGGGIATYGIGGASLIVRDSTISNNISPPSFGSGSGLSFSSNNSTATISNSTISNNDIATAATQLMVQVSNSTISSGGIFNNWIFELTHSTVNNGSIANCGGFLRLANNIFNNTDIGCSSCVTTSLGYNLNSGGGSYTPGPGDLFNTDPLLGPLQDNGGPTLTYNLLKGSPAINAGDPNFTPPPFTDQRGYSRVYNGRIDIGSLETQPTPAFTPTLTPSPSPSSSPSPSASATPTPSPSQLANISTRLHVGTGDDVGIGGFIISGESSLQVVIRAIGPSLGQLGVPDPLIDPILEVRDSSGVLLIQNDNWQDNEPQAKYLEKFGLAPTEPAESGLIIALPPGAYTATVLGKNNGTGTGLVEVYNVDESVPANNIELANISTRGLVQTGENVMIGGFILGSGKNSGIIVRGIGPSLSEFGIPNALADPTLELRDNNGALLVANDNWQDDPASAAQLSAHGLAPSNPNESGIYMSLQGGLYTAILAGNNGGTGVGLVEIYNVH